MKRTILFFISIFMATAIYSQPNFTSADMPGVGDGDTLMYLNYHVINNNLDTETGNGYTWDFSTLPFSTYPNFKKVDSFRLKTHNVSAPYVNASLEEYVKDGTAGDVNLFSYSGDTLYIHRVGGVASGAATYIPALASIAFPISFNSSSIINANIYFNGGVVGERKTTALYDGYGTLQMPDGKSYNNVFRIIKTERDTNYVSHGVATTTNYIWYKKGGQVPVLRITYSGSPTLYFVHGLKSSGGGTVNPPTGIEETSDQTKISVYPNPSTGKIQLVIKDATSEINSIEIYNVLGEKVFQTTISSTSSTIDISDKPNGVYFITLKTETTSFSQKIVIKK